MPPHPTGQGLFRGAPVRECQECRDDFDVGRCGPYGAAHRRCVLGGGRAAHNGRSVDQRPLILPIVLVY